jgi:hypothetical protein
MPIVDKQVFEAGDIPTAAELNEVYDDLAAASASIDSDNTAAGWLTHKHLDDPSSLKPVNKLYAYQNAESTAVAYTSTSWTEVEDSLGAICEVDLNYLPNESEIIRIHISGLVSVNTVVKDYDFVGTDLGKPNYYAFRIKLTYSDSGGADQYYYPGYWGYSFTTNNGSNRYETVSTPTGPSIDWQTFQAATIYKYLGTTGVREWKKATLEVALFSNANTLRITRHSIQVIRGKR